MRLLALLPAAMCIAALVLSFLCLFAGSNTQFLPSYDIVTVSRDPEQQPASKEVHK